MTYPHFFWDLISSLIPSFTLNQKKINNYWCTNYQTLHYGLHLNEMSKIYQIYHIISLLNRIFWRNINWNLSIICKSITFEEPLQKCEIPGSKKYTICGTQHDWQSAPCINTFTKYINCINLLPLSKISVQKIEEAERKREEILSCIANQHGGCHQLHELHRS